MKKFSCSLLVLAFFSQVLFAQSGYFVKDSVLSFGDIKLIDNGDHINSRLCQVKERDKVISYTPYQVKEYGFRDGRVYLAKDIILQDSTERVFLERLYKGQTDLFYYKSRGKKIFYIVKDSAILLEIPKKNKSNISYHDQLLSLTQNCSNVAKASKLVSYRKKPFTKLIARYNDCELKPFPHFKYGLVVGYEFQKLIDNEENDFLKFFDLSYDGAFTYGLFIDNPILVSDFSLHAELIYAKHGYSYNSLSENKDLDFVANISSVKIPMLLRYTYPSNILRPFINVGGIVNFNMKKENSLYETTIDGNTYTINEVQKNSLIADNQFGYSVGAGVECNINYRNSILLELRYNKINSNDYLDSTILNVMTSLSF